MNEFINQLESKQKYLSSGLSQVDYSDKVLFDRFLEEYNHHNQKGTDIKSLSFDDRNIEKIHKEKLGKMSLEMTESITALPLSDISKNSFSDEKYTLKRLCKSCRRHILLRDKNGKVYDKKSNVYFEFSVINSKANCIKDNEKLSCPYCGKIQELKKMEEACEQCKNEVYIIDHFPKAKGVCCRKNYNITIVSILKNIIICCVAGFFLGFPFGLAEFIGRVSSLFTTDTMMKSIANVFTAPFKGVVIGIIVSFLIIISHIIYKNIKMNSYMKKTQDARKEITSYLKEKDKYFSFKKFESDLVDKIKLILYSDNRDQLVICKLSSPIRKFNIADTIYDGIIELKNIHIEYSVCEIVLNVHMLNIYYHNGKFEEKNEIFKVTLKKRLTNKTDLGFELTNVECPICKEHYNSLSDKECDFCGSEYYLEDNDFIITGMEIL